MKPSPALRRRGGRRGSRRRRPGAVRSTRGRQGADRGGRRLRGRAAAGLAADERHRPGAQHRQRARRPASPSPGRRRGKGRFQLIGVSEFDLPAHKGHTVLVKGLLVKAAPVSRVNVTSVTMVATTCPPPAK